MAASDGPAGTTRAGETETAATSPATRPMARRSVLVPLGIEGRADAVTERLREAIFLGILPDGEPLPSEAELSLELAVSTKTLRESLAVLRAEGLIETRRGRGGGSFVQSYGRVQRSLVRKRLASLSASQLRDLSDEHRAVSGMAALLAASRADDDQIALLSSRALALAEAASGMARSRTDSQFHIEVAVASQSERLTRAEVLLQRESRDLLWANENAIDQSRASAEHLAIYEAIGHQDGEAARELAELHVISNYRHLLDVRLKMRRLQ